MDVHTQVVDVDFSAPGNLSTFSPTGFSEPETLGTWSVGAESSLLMPIPPNGLKAELSLVLYPATAEGIRAGQALSILAGEDELYSDVVTEETSLRLALPTSSWSSNELRLRFRHPTPVTPADSSNSADKRALAFLFIRLELTVQVDLTDGAASRSDRRPEPPRDVAVGKDGWLFLIGGANEVIRYYTEPDYFTERDADQWADLLLSRHASLANAGIGYLHVIAPDKMSVYPDYVERPLSHFGRHPARMLTRALHRADRLDVLINPLDEFLARPERDQLYLKTDTHWSYLAARLVFEMVARRLGEFCTHDVGSRSTRQYDATLDLGGKFWPQIKEQVVHYPTHPSVELVYQNELARRFLERVAQGKKIVHNSSHMIFRNREPSAISKTIVIFGDSFMDIQESNATAIFAEHFREVHFIWSPHLDLGYIAKVRPDIVLSEGAERFMREVPNDAEYDVAMDADRRLLDYPE